jgi:hypothetical protein
LIEEIWDSLAAWRWRPIRTERDKRLRLTVRLMVALPLAGFRCPSRITVDRERRSS